MSWHEQEEIDAIAREGIAQKLNLLIERYDGSPDAAKEILRGLAAARDMDMDCRPFEDALAARHRSLDAA
jgi:hypothetical protein